MTRPAPHWGEGRIFALMQPSKYLALAFLLLLASCRERVAESQDPEQFDVLLDQYEDRERDSWQMPEKVLGALGDLQGKTVVDLGAGSGYFTFRLLPVAGKVIALEIDPRFIAYLEDRKSQWPDSLAQRLEVRLASLEDPHLQAGEADAVLLVNTYMYLRDRVAYFRHLRSRMSRGGLLLVVDYQRKPTRMGPPLEIRVARHTVVEELRQAGFMEVSADTHTLPYQYIVSARVP